MSGSLFTTVSGPDQRYRDPPESPNGEFRGVVRKTWYAGHAEPRLHATSAFTSELAARGSGPQPARASNHESSVRIVEITELSIPRKTVDRGAFWGAREQNGVGGGEDSHDAGPRGPQVHPHVGARYPMHGGGAAWPRVGGATRLSMPIRWEHAATSPKWEFPYAGVWISQKSPIHLAPRDHGRDCDESL